MKLAIVGSTQFSHPEAFHLARQIILFKLEIFTPELVVSGGAAGIDSLAEECALGMDIEFLPFLPKNRRWKPEGFEARNIQIGDSCTHLLAIRDHLRSANNGWMPANLDATYGSGWTADYAQKLGKPVERIVL